MVIYCTYMCLFFGQIKNILLLGTSSTMQGISTLESQLGMSKPDSPRQIIDAPGSRHGNHAAGRSMYGSAVNGVLRFFLQNARHSNPGKVVPLSVKISKRIVSKKCPP